MSALTLEDVMAAVESLNGEVRALRADLDALKADVEATSAEQAAEVSAETLVMLAAAVTSYLGKRVRIRSARLAKPANGAPAWARHGRAAIQTSHQLKRGH